MPESCSVLPSSPVTEFELPLPIGWLDPDAGKVLRRLRHGGHIAYLVGGCVRDLLLGKYPKDFDIATSALPREVKRSFSNCRLVGRRFRLAHILFQDKVIEVATFRREPGSTEPDEEHPEDLEDDFFIRRRRAGRKGRAGDDGRARAEEEGGESEAGVEEGGRERREEVEEDLLIRSDNVFGTPREDAVRRDFTINALFYDMATSQVIDWSGGMRDIEARKVRTIGLPEVRFREDPVRMLRAVKFAAGLRFTIEDDTWRALKQVAPDITRSAAPRLLEELFRMLRSGSAVASFKLLEQGGLLQHLVPEISALVKDELQLADVPPVEEDDEDEASERGGRPSGVPRRPLAPVLAYLAALDQVDQVGLPLPNHLGLALVCLVPALAPLLERDQQNISDEVFERAGELLEGMASRLRISRRDRERARLVLMGVARILFRSERSSLNSLSRKSYFPESLTLYLLHVIATGHGVEEARRWSRKVEFSPESVRVLDAFHRLFGESSVSAAQEVVASLAAPAGARVVEEPTGERRRRRRSRRRGGSRGRSGGSEGGAAGGEAAGVDVQDGD